MLPKRERLFKVKVTALHNFQVKGSEENCLGQGKSSLLAIGAVIVVAALVIAAVEVTSLLNLR